MQKLAPFISFVLWTVWFLLTVINYAQHVWIPKNGAGFANVWSDVGVKGAGIALSVLLFLRPNRGLAFLLALLCLFAFWKFYLSGILINMIPQFGGLTLIQSVAQWWNASMVGWFHALRVIGFLLFVTGSVVYWPWHAMQFQTSAAGKGNRR